MVRPVREDRHVVRFTRADFLTGVWDYKPGEHVTILAPTGGGKTQMSYDLLGVTMTPELPAVIFVMKPKDDTIARYTRMHKLRTVRDWPPTAGNLAQRVFREKPKGWVLWPRETADPEHDDARHSAIFQRALRERYRKGNSIVFADETFSLEREMGLTRDLNRIWTKGRSNEAGLWAASQRPRYISLWAYQAHHLFLANDPDVESQKRLGDIGGGIDPEDVRSTLRKLQRFEFCYINREERTMCIVEAD